MPACQSACFVFLTCIVDRLEEYGVNDSESCVVVSLGLLSSVQVTSLLIGQRLYFTEIHSRKDRLATRMVEHS